MALWREWWFVSLASGLALIAGTACRGGGAEPAGEEDPREARLRFMQKKLDEFVLTAARDPDLPLQRTQEPVLRFSNPVRDSFSDGAIYLWLKGKRPAAVASLWIRADGDFGRDFASLSRSPLECRRNGEVIWSPRSGYVVEVPLPDAPEPAATMPGRLAQMRGQARRFTALFRPWPAEGLDELRLLPQPIYRYSSPEDGIVDGAVFALAQANDPELLLVLEIARSADGSAYEWRYSLARMTAVRLKVRLDGAEVWSVEGYWTNPRSRSDAYIESVEGKYIDGTGPDAKSGRELLPSPGIPAS